MEETNKTPLLNGVILRRISRPRRQGSLQVGSNVWRENKSHSGDSALHLGNRELPQTTTTSKDAELEQSYDQYGEPDEAETDERLDEGVVVDDDWEPNDEDYPGLGHL